jgi:hypothetical protein
MPLFGHTLQKLPRGQASNSRPPQVRPQTLIHNPHHPHISHDPRTRPLAGSIAAVAGCAPLHCVIAPGQSLRRPSCLGDAVRRLLLRFALDLHRALFLSRRPQLPSQAARLCTVSLPLARSLRRPGCLGDAVSRFLRQPALRSLFDLAIMPPALPNTLPVGLTFATLPPLALSSTYP